MYSTNPKSRKTFTIRTKYIIQLHKIFPLVDFESIQNIFLKQLTSEKNTRARIRERDVLNYQGKWSKILELQSILKLHQNLECTKTVTKIQRAFTDLLFSHFLFYQVSKGVHRSWDTCQIEWHQCHDKTEKFHEIFISGVVSEVFDKLSEFSQPKMIF